MGLVEVEYRELLDGDDEVVGYIDPDGMAYEYQEGGGEPEVYEFATYDDPDAKRVEGDRILVPEYALSVFEDIDPIDEDSSQ